MSYLLKSDLAEKFCISQVLPLCNEGEIRGKDQLNERLNQFPKREYGVLCI